MTQTLTVSRTLAVLIATVGVVTDGRGSPVSTGIGVYQGCAVLMIVGHQSPPPTGGVGL